MRNRIASTLAVLLAGSAVALATSTVGPAQAAVSTACVPSLAVYGVAANGDLREWLDAVPTTSGGVTAVATAQRTSMGAYSKVIAGGNGVIYVIDATGHLLWFRHTGWATGQPTWDAASGKEIGHGWSAFKTVVTDGNGTIYGVDAIGQLRWYHHNSYLAGGGTFATGSGAVVAQGWNAFSRIVSAGNGTFYVTNATNALLWYHHNGWLTGRAAWSANSGVVVGAGWTFPTLLSGGGGVLLGVGADGSVRWYNHLGVLDGAWRWTTGNGATQTGMNLAGLSNLTADPMACNPLDRADIPGIQRLAAQMINGRGLASTEYTCLNNIVLKESSWRWNAGTVAGAYGIPQALPGSKMATTGADWQTSPVTQVTWMLDYIAGRYVTPCGAWTFWQAHNYY